MITFLITLLIYGLVLYVIYHICSLFIQGKILQIIGAILALIFLLSVINSLTGWGGGHFLPRP